MTTIINHRLLLLGTLLTALLWAMGCPDEDDDDAADDDAGDDDAADDDAGDDDSGDDDSGDDDSGDDDVDPHEMLGKTYLLDLGGGGFQYTPDVGGALGVLLPDDSGVAFSATAIDEGAGTIELLIGSVMVEDPELDPSQWVWVQTAAETTTTSGNWYNPGFDGGPTDILLESGGVPIWISQLVFGGQYPLDGAIIEDTTLEGMVDLASFDEMLGSKPGFICGMLEVTQIYCTTCPLGSPHEGLDYCLDLDAEGGTCPLVEGVELVPVP
jgi:hypothetical protein